MTMIGFSSVKDSVGEVIYPDEYEKYEVTTYFNRREKYLTEVSVIIDATDKDKIGDITFIEEITLQKRKNSAGLGQDLMAQ